MGAESSYHFSGMYMKFHPISQTEYNNGLEIEMKGGKNKFKFSS